MMLKKFLLLLLLLVFLFFFVVFVVLATTYWKWSAIFVRAFSMHAFIIIIYIYILNDSLRINNNNKKNVLFALCAGELLLWTAESALLLLSFHSRWLSQWYKFLFFIRLGRSSWNLRSCKWYAISFVSDAYLHPFSLRRSRRSDAIPDDCLSHGFVFIALAVCTLHQPTNRRSNKLQLRATK